MRFKKMFKKLLKSGRFDDSIFDLIASRLIQGIPLDPKFHDHALTGDYSSYRECHLTPNLLLIYEKDTKLKEIRFIKIGSHSELFG